jgi:hypothetical protein
MEGLLEGSDNESGGQANSENDRQVKSMVCIDGDENDGVEAGSQMVQDERDQVNVRWPRVVSNPCPELELSPCDKDEENDE